MSSITPRKLKHIYENVREILVAVTYRIAYRGILVARHSVVLMFGVNVSIQNVTETFKNTTVNKNKMLPRYGYSYYRHFQTLDIHLELSVSIARKQI